MFKRLVFILPIIVFALAVSGCDDKSSEIAGLKNQISALQKENEELKKQNSDMSQQIELFAKQHKEEMRRFTEPKFKFDPTYKGANPF